MRRLSECLVSCPALPAVAARSLAVLAVPAATLVGWLASPDVLLGPARHACVQVPGRRAGGYAVGPGRDRAPGVCGPLDLHAAAAAPPGCGLAPRLVGAVAGLEHAAVQRVGTRKARLGKGPDGGCRVDHGDMKLRQATWCLGSCVGRRDAGAVAVAVAAASRAPRPGAGPAVKCRRMRCSLRDSCWRAGEKDGGGGEGDGADFSSFEQLPRCSGIRIRAWQICCMRLGEC